MMKKVVAIVCIALTLFSAGCNQGGNKQPAIEKTTVDTIAGTTIDSGAVKMVDCNTSADVDIVFPIDSPNLITFQPDNTNHTVSILFRGDCKQTLRIGDVRRWYIQRTGSLGSYVFHFIDKASTNAFGNGTLKFPISGDECSLKLFFDQGTGDCSYRLIGTDDVRDWGLGRAQYAIYNQSASISKYVDVTIDTAYRVLIKHPGFTATTQPPNCNICRPVCFTPSETCP